MPAPDADDHKTDGLNELAEAWAQSQADRAAGRCVVESAQAHVARLTALLVTDELSKPVENVPPGNVPRRPGP